MKRWKGAALLLLCTVAMLRLLQGLAQPEKENAHVPVLGIVTTAAEDDRREAQSEALVHAAEEHGFKVLADRVSGGRNRIYAAGGKRLGQRAARSKIRLRAAAVDRPRDTRRG